jgi:hypothetical protein
MIENLASSPDKGSFSKKKFNEIISNKDEHTDESVKHAEEMLGFFKTLDDITTERENDPEWKKDNMEYDLRTTGWIIDKVKMSESYAQNLYAAMCNTEFQKIDNWAILSDKTWSCSWRYAGGIVANMKGEGDYIDYYCSGIRGEPLDEESEKYKSLTDEQKRYIIESERFVSESVITDEIRNDLRKLGWVILDNEDTNI